MYFSQFLDFWTTYSLTMAYDRSWPSATPCTTVIMNLLTLCPVAPPDLAHQHSGGPSEFNHVLALFLPHNLKFSTTSVCELPEVVLACSDTFTNNVVLYLVASVIGFLYTGILLLFSNCLFYSLRISTGGKYKAFPLVGLTSVVSLFYGTCLGVYLSSTWTHDSQTRGVCLCPVHHGHPHTQSFHLQPEEQETKELRKLLTCVVSQ